MRRSKLGKTSDKNADTGAVYKAPLSVIVIIIHNISWIRKFKDLIIDPTDPLDTRTSKASSTQSDGKIPEDNKDFNDLKGDIFNAYILNCGFVV